MVQRVFRSPQALIVLSFGIVLGAVWAAGGAANAAPKPPKSGGVSITAGDGLQASPNNPITSTGTLSVKFGGTGAATTAARSDHDHNGAYLPLSGGTLTGNLTLGSGVQLIAPRVENAAQGPANAQPGQLFWNTASQTLEVFNGSEWQTVSGGGGAGSSILGVSRPPWQTTTSFVALATTSASVTFTLSSAADVILEFGGEYE